MNVVSLLPHSIDSMVSPDQVRGSPTGKRVAESNAWAWELDARMKYALLGDARRGIVGVKPGSNVCRAGIETNETISLDERALGVEMAILPLEVVTIRDQQHLSILHHFLRHCDTRGAPPIAAELRLGDWDHPWILDPRLTRGTFRHMMVCSGIRIFREIQLGQILQRLRHVAMVSLVVLPGSSYPCNTGRYDSWDLDAFHRTRHPSEAAVDWIALRCPAWMFPLIQPFAPKLRLVWLDDLFDAKILQTVPAATVRHVKVQGGRSPPISSKLRVTRAEPPTSSHSLLLHWIIPMHLAPASASASAAPPPLRQKRPRSSSNSSSNSSDERPTPPPAHTASWL